MTDILAAIDAAIGCQQCGGPLGASPSDDFCTDWCQERWHEARAEPLLEYNEPSDLAAHVYNQVEWPHLGVAGLDSAAWMRLRPETAVTLYDEILRIYGLRSEHLELARPGSAGETYTWSFDGGHAADWCLPMYSIEPTRLEPIEPDPVTELRLGVTPTYEITEPDQTPTLLAANPQRPQGATIWLNGKSFEVTEYEWDGDLTGTAGLSAERMTLAPTAGPTHRRRRDRP